MRTAVEEGKLELLLAPLGCNIALGQDEAVRPKERQVDSQSQAKTYLVRQTFSSQASQRLTVCCISMQALMLRTGLPMPFADVQAWS